MPYEFAVKNALHMEIRPQRLAKERHLFLLDVRNDITTSDLAEMVQIRPCVITSEANYTMFSV